MGIKVRMCVCGQTGSLSVGLETGSLYIQIQVVIYTHTKWEECFVEKQAVLLVAETSES